MTKHSVECRGFSLEWTMPKVHMDTLSRHHMGKKSSQNHFQAFYWASGAWLKSMQNRTQQPFKPQHQIVTKKCIYNDTQQLQSMSKRVLISLWTWNDKNENCGSTVTGSGFALFDSPSSHTQIIVKNSSGCPQMVSDQVILIVQIEVTCARALRLKEWG